MYTLAIFNYHKIIEIDKNFKSTIDNYIRCLVKVKNFDEAVKCYRVITGACQFGVKDFLSRKEVKKKSFTIQEMITLTQNEYGNSEFTKFFTK